MENTCCKSCPYWADVGARPVGAGPGGTTFGEMPKGSPRECRANPPGAAIVPVQSVAGMRMSVMSMHPLTAPDHWCGNHPTLDADRARRRGAAEHSGREDGLRLDPGTGKFNRLPTPEEFARFLEQSGGKVSTVDVRTGTVKPVLGEDDPGLMP